MRQAATDAAIDHVQVFGWALIRLVALTHIRIQTSGTRGH